ncbi:hypothetical protein HJC23_001247 [Cyclotella cryptica]|uniref:Uncharacterized protein n=1 Tax=Cyclotella cryptica TaxID=29204 RepID=A0ABD3NU67_9STRA
MFVLCVCRFRSPLHQALVTSRDFAAETQPEYSKTMASSHLKSFSFSCFFCVFVVPLGLPPALVPSLYELFVTSADVMLSIIGEVKGSSLFWFDLRVFHLIV